MTQKIRSIPHSDKVGEADLAFAIRTAVVGRVPRSALHYYESPERLPSLGDVVLVEVLEVGEDERVEIGSPAWDDPEAHGTVPHVQKIVSFATLSLAVGKKLLCAVGGRYATDYLQCDVPTEIMKTLDLVTFGGVVGAVCSSNSRRGKITKVKPLAYFSDSSGQIINTRSFIPDGLDASPFDLGEVRLIVVTGGSMEAGKTTSAAALAGALVKQGSEVYVGKATGCGSFRDPHRLSAGGVAGTSEFMALGYPSTHQISESEVRGLFWSLLSLLVKAGKKSTIRSNRQIVIEIADGLGQRETRALLQSPEIRKAASAIIYAAPDAVSAAGGIKILTEWGWNIPIISGPVASSKLGCNEVRTLCHGQNITFFDNLKPPSISDFFWNRFK